MFYLSVYIYYQKFKQNKTKQKTKDFPGGLVAKTLRSQCRDLGSIPGWGTRSQVLQLRPGAAK